MTRLPQSFKTVTFQIDEIGLPRYPECTCASSPSRFKTEASPLHRQGSSCHNGYVKRIATVLVLALACTLPACAREPEPIEVDPYHCWDSIEHMWKDCDWSAEVRAWAIRNKIKHYKVAGKDGKYHDVWIDAKRRQGR